LRFLLLQIIEIKMDSRKFYEKKGISIGLSFSYFVGFIFLIFLIFLLFAGTFNAKIRDSIPIFGEGKNKINEVKQISCENELANVLIKLANSPVIIDGKEMKISEAIENSSISNDLFKLNSDEIFSDAFPKERWKGVHPWWVRVQNSEDKNEMPRFSDKFSAGAYNCNVNKDIVLDINLGNKKIVGCLFKTYCEKIK